MGCCGCWCKKKKKPEPVVPEEKKDANENVVQARAAPVREERPASPKLPTEPYPLNFPRMGRCIVVHQNFLAPSTNVDSTQATDEDVRSLAWSFTRLHFQVDVVHNRTVAELRALVTELSAFDHSRYSCFVLCVVSHGERGLIFGGDEGKKLLRDVVDAFSPTRCPSLKGKPKLFVIQACRPAEGSAGAQKKSPGPLNAADAMPPLQADMVLACAAAEGYVEHIDSSVGTPFIQKFCRVLDSSDVGNMHILDILSSVNRGLAAEFGKTKGYTKQSTSVGSHLSKLFYLRPRPV